MANLHLTIFMVGMASFFIATKQIQTVSQSFNVDHHSDVTLIAEGSVDYEYWNGDRVVVETTIQSNSGNAFALNYAIQRGHFKLEKTVNAQGIVIAPRKINTILLAEGQRHTTKTSYKVLVPKTVWYKKKQTLSGR